MPENANIIPSLEVVLIAWSSTGIESKYVTKPTPTQAGIRESIAPLGRLLPYKTKFMMATVGVSSMRAIW